MLVESDRSGVLQARSATAPLTAISARNKSISAPPGLWREASRKLLERGEVIARSLAAASRA